MRLSYLLSGIEAAPDTASGRQETGSPMALYYFNFFNDIDTIAEEGVDLPDLASAEEEARRGAATMIAEHIMKGEAINPRHRIEVEDARRHTVFTLRFCDLILRD